MNIDILSLRHYSPNEKAINVALPVLAVECEATPPLENKLDAYEEAVLKFLLIGLSSNGIANALNATESLVEEILDRLEQKNYAIKETGKPWKLTEDGNKYLSGSNSERESKNSQFGFMFVNAIKKDVLPFFYQGDINQIDLFRGQTLPAKLTVGGDEEKTFEPFPVKRAKLREAYKKWFRNANTTTQYNDGDITLDEAVDLFEELESFDEEDEQEATFNDVAVEKDISLQKNMFIRSLNCPPKRVYLTMRIIIDPHFPGGYRVESPFDFHGMDNNDFLRQIQWLVATNSTFIGDEEIKTYLEREIVKISPSYKNTDKDCSVFVLERIPLLKVYRDKFPSIYEDMSRAYGLMQRQDSLLEKETIVGYIHRYIVEHLLNQFFRGIKQETLWNISKNAKADLDHGCIPFIQMITAQTGLDSNSIQWSYNFVSNAIGRMSYTRGNSIVEKFINLVVLNYYMGTSETRRFLANQNTQRFYELSEGINEIRRKVTHDTDERFEPSDYMYYMSNVFELINGLLEAYRED